jgi:CsoR family transcriptional regulator, copper-sensing transcriptional repressor
MSNVEPEAIEPTDPGSRRTRSTASSSAAASTPEAHFRHSYSRDRRELLNRLSRIEGQVRGVRRLVEEEAYCLDVLQQVEAMTAAADQVRLLLLEDHIDGCLTHAISTGEGEAYVAELMEVIRRSMGRRPPRSRGAGGQGG